MVGSVLNCTATAHLMGLAGLGDVDGPLLVDDNDVFSGGLSFAADDHYEASKDKRFVCTGEEAKALPHGSVVLTGMGLGVGVRRT